jgi:zinc D-Ala-D-Ala carboxypeptidase
MRRAWLSAVVVLAACASPADLLRSPAVPTHGPVSTTPTIERGSHAGGGPELVHHLAPLARPVQPVISARYVTGLASDPCVDRDLVTPWLSDPALAVLDRTYALPPDFAPHDLVPASAAGLSGTAGTKLVRSIVVDDLAALRSAWRAAGLSVVVDSAYRSYATQGATFESWASRLGYAEALVRSARPGHSEHQLGTAIDVSSPGWGGRFGDWAAQTAEGTWMASNAWRYGFVMSYPSGAQGQTCFSYEPWHYRWVGREAAAAQRESGLTLREFLERRLDD